MNTRQSLRKRAMRVSNADAIGSPPRINVRGTCACSPSSSAAKCEGTIFRQSMACCCTKAAKRLASCICSSLATCRVAPLNNAPNNAVLPRSAATVEVKPTCRHCSSPSAWLTCAV
ncbi:hypothetical protein D3C73_883130 [compost metagenome]